MAGRLSLSYTAAGIRRTETVTLAKAYAELQDWAAVRKSSVDDDLLMIRQESSRKRVTAELLKRLRNLTPAELAALAQPQSAGFASALCWLAICRTYEFIRGFTINIVGERWNEGVRTLPLGAYETYIAEESTIHPELEGLSDQTKARLRSQLFTMMREMGFLDKQQEMHPYLMPEGVSSIIDEEDFVFFPTLVR